MSTKLINKFHVIPGVHETGVTRRNDPAAQKADEEFDHELHVKIRNRDRSRCRACGIAIKEDPEVAGGLEIHHIDHNHANNDESNLVLLCPMCHQIQTINQLTLDKGKRVEARIMKLIYLPDINQEDLNLLTWILAVTLYRCQNTTMDDPHIEEINKVRENANSIIQDLLNCTQFPDDYFRYSICTNDEKNEEIAPDAYEIITKINCADESGRSDLSLLGNSLLDIKKKDQKKYNERDKWLGGLRIFFNISDENEPDVLESMFGGMVPRLSEMATLFPGKNWIESWSSIAEGIRTNVL